MRLTVLALVFLLVPETSVAQQAFPASELAFDDIFATRGGDESEMYSLLGAGFFRTPRSGEADSLVTEWLNRHPDARATPVSTMKPTMQDGSGEMTYIWLSDGAANLNVYLIRRGAFPGGVMEDHRAVAQHMEEIGEPMEGPEIQRFVTEEAYEAFMERVKEAEATAANEKLGIWSGDANR